MAVRKINESTLTAIGNAIRSKTGGSALINPEDMADAIESIQTGGGGSLPSNITELGGGSFTVDANTRCNAKQIQHGMTTTPKGFFIWSEDSFTESTSATTLYFVSGYFQRLNMRNPSGEVSGYYVCQYYRQSDARISVNSGARTAAQIPTFSTASYICLYSSNEYFQSGKTYKWIAWA